MDSFIFLAEGFEEIEAVAVIDILRRGGMSPTVVSITGNQTVIGSHGISVVADTLFETTDFSTGKILILPGGMPGTKHLGEHEGLQKLLIQYHAAGKYLAAICAAPSVLGDLNLLQGKTAVVYPGYEAHLSGAKITTEAAVADDKIITGRSPGSVFDFALRILTVLQGQTVVDSVVGGMIIPRRIG